MLHGITKTFFDPRELVVYKVSTNLEPDHFTKIVSKKSIVLIRKIANPQNKTATKTSCHTVHKINKAQWLKPEKFFCSMFL